METLTFSQKVKEELCSNIYDSQKRLRALLCGFVRTNGTAVFRDKKTVVSLKSENAKIAKFIYQNISGLLNINCKLKFTKNKKRQTYLIEISDGDNLIEMLEISFLEGKISKNIVFNDETIAGYLAGAFLASGSVNSPETSNYHLEIMVNSENYAKWLGKLFLKYKGSNIEPKIILRRGNYVLYFKRSDRISDFLIMIGAVNCCMEFEDLRINRDFLNSTNRLTNSDMANMKKTYETGLRQSKEIKVIINRIGLENLENDKMRQLCLLRLENESASLGDLAILLSKKIGFTVSKSNINHIFRSIHTLYEKVK